MTTVEAVVTMTTSRSADHADQFVATGHELPIFVCGSGDDEVVEERVQESLTAIMRHITTDSTRPAIEYLRARGVELHIVPEEPSPPTHSSTRRVAVYA